MKILKIEANVVTVEMSRLELRAIGDALALAAEHSPPNGVSAMMRNRIENALLENRHSVGIATANDLFRQTMIQGPRGTRSF